MTDPRAAHETPRSEFAESLRRGLLIGAAALVLIVPPVLHFAPHRAPSAAATAPARHHVVRHADFRGETASDNVHRFADWVADSRDNGRHWFVVLDKPQAKVFLFDSNARLDAAAPAVLGETIGDDSTPGVGDKPLSALKPEDLTTPAGRFVAELGETSSRHEDVVWVSYDMALSMHRIIKVPERLKAIATPDPSDNRLSHGCINLPDSFYEQHLRPAQDRTGLIVYILPETRPLQRTFASFYDVDAPIKLAQH
jgi:hypothetical protein